MRKLTVLVAGAIGYVLGTRAGRERYEQIRGLANKVKDKLSGAAEAARSKVSGGGDHVDDLPDESLVNQDDPYPKGDLP